MAAGTDFEYMVLGVIQLKGPCTPYAVRQTFARSPSSHWSGSAGATYPAVQRLEQRGLLVSRASRTGKRRSRLYELTREGLAAFKDWLRPPLPDASALMDVDPVRLRVRFLSVLTPKQRRAFVEEADAKLREQVVRVKARCAQDEVAGDEFACIVGRGAIRSLRSRIAWLREIVEALDEMG